MIPWSFLSSSDTLFSFFSLPSDGDTKWGIKSTRHSCVWNPCDAPVKPCEASCLSTFYPLFSTVCPLSLCFFPCCWCLCISSPVVLCCQVLRQVCCQASAGKLLLLSPCCRWTLMSSPDVKPCYQALLSALLSSPCQFCCQALCCQVSVVKLPAVKSCYW
jgi:hypothetical protein